MRLLKSPDVCLTVLLLSVSPFALADHDIFKWVDADGVTHFGDRPLQSDAELVIIARDRESTDGLAEADADQVSAESDTIAADTADDFNYENLEIISPVSDGAYPGGEGTMVVSLSLEPALREGDDLRIFFNGSRQSLESLDFRLDNVSPGEHRLQAEVVSASGELMIRSQQVRFFVR